MQKLHDIIYDAKPATVTVYDTSVMVVTACTEVEVTDEMSGTTSTKWKCEVDQYTNAEYIDILQQANADLSKQSTSLQLAMVEVYEMLLGEGV